MKLFKDAPFMSVEEALGEFFGFITYKVMYWLFIT